MRAWPLIIAFVMLGSLVACGMTPVHARDNGQYAQASPAEREWFNKQLVPGSGMKCCSEADGITAQEDIREGHYWTRFTAQVPIWHAETSEYTKIEQDSGWLEVPDKAVLQGPNKMGRPIVWWWADTAGKLRVRCYAPGAGL